MAKEPEFVIDPEAQKQLDAIIAEDPKAKAGFAELFACIRQAQQAWAEGRYPSFEDALEAITGNRPERIDE